LFCNDPRNNGVKMMRVMLVEDEADLLEVMDFILSSRQVEVVKATSRDEALRKIEQGTHVHAIFLDWHMPGMTCEEFLAKIRAIDPGLPVILISADIRIVKYAEQLGIAFIPKPFGIDEIFATVEGLRLGRKGTGTYRALAALPTK
jgi:two-component system, response regulator FlrC